jgi:hypothetical protein
MKGHPPREPIRRLDMSKIGTIGGAALAATFLATVFYYHPSSASNALLAQAQSEFMTQARDALLARRIGGVSTNNVLAAAAAPAQSYVVASLEPVAPPSTAQVETPVSAQVEIPAATAAPIFSAATEDLVETPAVVNELPEPAKVEISAAVQVNEVKPEVAPLPAEPVTQQNATAPKKPVTPAPQIVAPLTNPVAHLPVKAVQKTTETPSRKTIVAARHPERAILRERLPYNLEALRARAPQIMAAIARYI